MQNYFLSPHVHYCLVDGHVVFLDLLHDRYACLEPEQTALVAGKVQGLAGLRDLAAKSGPLLNGHAHEVVQQLLEADLLTPDRSAGTVRLPPHVPDPELDLEDYDLADPPAVAPRDVLNFFRAMLSALIELWLFRTEHAFEQIKRRKRGARIRVEERRVAGLVRTFKRLRPLFFTTRNHCFFDSVALVKFLACYGVRADLVIGVRMAPFTAHAWVQRQHLVLNDWAAVAAIHTPIMVV